MRRAAAISLGLDASMRPRHKAAENAELRGQDRERLFELQ